MEDCEIIPLLKSEPSRGIREAVQKYRSYAAAITARILGGNEQDVEECVSDAFAAVWKIAQSSEEIRSLKGCIAIAARNAAINRWKTLRRERAADLDELELPSEEDIVLDFENSADALAVQELVACMDEPDREIFVRRYYLLESIREISRRTELDEIQIKNRLYRGRQKLRKQLEERDITA